MEVEDEHDDEPDAKPDAGPATRGQHRVRRRLGVLVADGDWKLIHVDVVLAAAVVGVGLHHGSGRGRRTAPQTRSSETWRCEAQSCVL